MNSRTLLMLLLTFTICSAHALTPQQKKEISEARIRALFNAHDPNNASYAIATQLSNQLYKNIWNTEAHTQCPTNGDVIRVTDDAVIDSIRTQAAFYAKKRTSNKDIVGETAKIIADQAKQRLYFGGLRDFVDEKLEKQIPGALARATTLVYGPQVECAVTMCSGVGRPVKLPCCSHAMHHSCYTLWKKSCNDRHVDFTCPQCRAVIQESSIPGGPEPRNDNPSAPSLFQIILNIFS